MSGTELTRNHLSLIESGKSLPSLKNICYIADRLDIPVGYLFSGDENEDARFISSHAADKIKSLFEDGDFNSCIDVCRSIPENIRSDEITLLYAKALFNEAISYANAFDMNSADDTLTEAVQIADKCIYLADDFTDAAEYYYLLFGSISSTVIPAMLCDLHEISSYVDAELVMYMRLLSGENVNSDFFRDELHRCHANAILFIKEGKTEEAFRLLEKLSESTTLPFYMKYRVYDDLEKCASAVGEFRAAYSAAKKKLELTVR